MLRTIVIHKKSPPRIFQSKGGLLIYLVTRSNIVNMSQGNSCNTPTGSSINRCFHLSGSFSKPLAARLSIACKLASRSHGSIHMSARSVCTPHADPFPQRLHKSHTRLLHNHAIPWLLLSGMPQLLHSRQADRHNPQLITQLEIFV